MGCQKINHVQATDMNGQKFSSCNKELLPIEEYVVLDTKLNDKLDEVQLNHNTCLKNGTPTSKNVVRYDCVRAGKPRRTIYRSRRSKSTKCCDVCFMSK